MKDHVPAISYFPSSDEQQWYPAVMIGATAIGARVIEQRQIRAARDLLALIAHDDYSLYMMNFYEDGLQRFGSDWGYADIVRFW